MPITKALGFYITTFFSKWSIVTSLFLLTSISCNLRLTNSLNLGQAVTKFAEMSRLFKLGACNFRRQSTFVSLFFHSHNYSNLGISAWVRGSRVVRPLSPKFNNCRLAYLNDEIILAIFGILFLCSHKFTKFSLFPILPMMTSISSNVCLSIDKVKLSCFWNLRTTLFRVAKVAFFCGGRWLRFDGFFIICDSLINYKGS